MVGHSQDYHSIVNVALSLIYSMSFLENGGLCFLTAQPYQKHYVYTVKRSVQRCACGTAATTINR